MATAVATAGGAMVITVVVDGFVTVGGGLLHRTAFFILVGLDPPRPCCCVM